MFLAKRLIDGDSTALEKIYTLYFSRVYGLCFKYVKDEQITSDLVQDIFLKLWNNRKNVSLEIPIDQQLFVITKNVVFDHFRKKSTEEKMLFQYTHGLGNEVTEDDDNKALKLKKINALIQNLPEQQRKVVEMAKLQGLTYEEIGNELNISRHTVSSHFTVAMKYLRKNLEILLICFKPF